jgi:hypothetical protein
MPLIPKVTEAQTKAFANAWDSGGIKVIMDATSIRFATDWANIALASFVQQIAQDMAKRIEAKKAAGPPPAKMQGDITVAPTDAVSKTHIPADAPPVKGRIILTD